MCNIELQGECRFGASRGGALRPVGTGVHLALGSLGWRDLPIGVGHRLPGTGAAGRLVGVAVRHWPDVGAGVRLTTGLPGSVAGRVPVVV